MLSIDELLNVTYPEGMRCCNKAYYGQGSCCPLTMFLINGGYIVELDRLAIIRQGSALFGESVFGFLAGFDGTEPRVSSYGRAYGEGFAVGKAALVKYYESPGLVSLT